MALSADGSTALIGGDQDDGGLGAAWVFTRSGSTWTQQGGKLTGAGEVGPGAFGTSVALSANGDTALIGGWSDKEWDGAAWVFTRSGSTWTQQGPKLPDPGRHGGATYYFEYGTGACETNTCGTETAPEGGPLSGATQQAVSFEVVGLKPHTTYHYWAVAKNHAAEGGVHGEAKEFTTPKSAEEIAAERAEREAKEKSEAEAKAKVEAEAQAAAAAKKHQEEEAVTAAAKKKQEEETIAKRKAEEAAGKSVFFTIVKVKLSSDSVTVTLDALRAGTATISGPGLKTTTKNVAVGTGQIWVALSGTGKHDREHHKKVKITVELTVMGKSTSEWKTIKL